MAQVNELLDRFVDLFNRGRYEEAETDFTANAYSEEVGTGRRLSVKEATANARAWKEAFPDARGTITNKSVEIRAVVVIETDGGKIKRSTHYIDVAGMMAQLGKAPAVV